MKFKERYEWEANRNLLSKRGGVYTYFSKDTILQREVCLKMTHISQEQTLQLIAQEAKEAMLSFHPNLCSYYDVILLDKFTTIGTENINILLVSEYIDGGTITEFCSLFKNDQTLKKLLIHSLSGINYLNEKGTSHPPIKPNNILVKKLFQNPTAKISDYINLHIQRNLSIDNLSTEDLSYMAPEMIHHWNDTIDREQADIWSFGVILFELIADYNLFYKKNLNKEQTIELISTAKLDLKDVSTSPYYAVIKKCLEIDLEKRYKKIGTVLEDIKTVKLEAPPTITPIAEVKASPAPVINNKEEPRIASTTIQKEEKNGETIEPFKSKKKNPKTTRTIDFLSDSKKETSFVDVYIPKEKDLGVGTYIIVVSTIFLLFFGVIFYSEFLNRIEQTENLKIIVKRRKIYVLPKKTEVNEVFTNTSPIPLSYAPSTVVRKSEPIVQIASPPPYSPPIQPEPVGPKQAFSVLQDEYFKIGEIKTINLLGKYPVSRIRLQSSTDGIEIKEIGKQLFMLKLKNSGTISVVDVENGEVLETKKISPSVVDEAIVYIGNDLRNATANNITVLSRVGLKAMGSDKDYTISSFRLVTNANGETLQAFSSGYVFSDKMKQIIKSAAPGQKLVFDQIRAKKPDGQEISLKEVYVHISQN